MADAATCRLGFALGPSCCNIIPSIRRPSRCFCSVSRDYRLPRDRLRRNVLASQGAASGSSVRGAGAKSVGKRLREEPPRTERHRVPLSRDAPGSGGGAAELERGEQPPGAAPSSSEEGATAIEKAPGGSTAQASREQSSGSEVISLGGAERGARSQGAPPHESSPPAALLPSRPPGQARVVPAPVSPRREIAMPLASPARADRTKRPRPSPEYEGGHSGYAGVEGGGGRADAQLLAATEESWRRSDGSGTEGTLGAKTSRKGSGLDGDGVRGGSGGGRDRSGLAKPHSVNGVGGRNPPADASAVSVARSAGKALTSSGGHP